MKIKLKISVDPFDHAALVEARERLDLQIAVAEMFAAVDRVGTGGEVPNVATIPNELEFVDVGATPDAVRSLCRHIKGHRLAEHYWPFLVHLFTHDGVCMREQAVQYRGKAPGEKLNNFTEPFTKGWQKALGVEVVPAGHQPVMPYYPTEGFKVRAAAFFLQPQILEVAKGMGLTNPDLQDWERDLLL